MRPEIRAKISGARREIASLYHRLEAHPLEVGEAAEVVAALTELRDAVDQVAAKAHASGAGALTVHAPYYASPARLPQKDPPITMVASDPPPPASTKQRDPPVTAAWPASEPHVDKG